MTEVTLPADAVGESDSPVLPDDRFQDRKLSWLAFNTRVLDLARGAVRVGIGRRTETR